MDKNLRRKKVSKTRTMTVMTPTTLKTQIKRAVSRHQATRVIKMTDVWMAKQESRSTLKNLAA